MDPLTAIGAVASIWQIAQAALSLSKTLYTLSSAVGSASEDIQILADDLKTFSQSLSLLSRLLEDSKSWYSDDIYLLTAKIIKDCADLYVKIDKILTKLGSNGKSNWKLRMKFVYKESQIQRLLSRLRDMKGTLATILMSLQVDLQLSLLNISSTSKIQRPPEKPLQPETLRILQEAQNSIMTGGILTKYTIESEGALHVFASRLHVSTTSSETGNSGPLKHCTASSTEDNSALRSAVHIKAQGPSSKLFHMTSNLIVSPDNFETFPPVIEPKNATISRTNKCLTYGRNINDIPDLFPKSDPLSSKDDFMESKSVKSSSSVESFKSAMSIQTHDLEIARKVKAVQSVLHAFRTAIQILGNLIDLRIAGVEIHLLASAKDLEASLNKGIVEIDQCHTHHFKEHGEAYIRLFDTVNSLTIQAASSELMKDLIIKLHEYSAEHEELHPSLFDTLAWRSTMVTTRVNHCLHSIAGQVSYNTRPSSGSVRASCTEPMGGPSTPSHRPYNPPPLLTAYTSSNPNFGNWFGGEGNTQQQPAVPAVPGRTPISCMHCASTGIACDKMVPCPRCAEKNLSCEVRFARRQAKIGARSKPSPEHPEMSLPFIGYNFKRFDRLVDPANQASSTTQMPNASTTKRAPWQDDVSKPASSTPVSPAYPPANPPGYLQSSPEVKAQRPYKPSLRKFPECGLLEHKQALEAQYAPRRNDTYPAARLAPPPPQSENEVRRIARIARASKRFNQRRAEKAALNDTATGNDSNADALRAMRLAQVAQVAQLQESLKAPFEQTTTSTYPTTAIDATVNPPTPIPTALQDYQKQLLAVDPVYKPSHTSRSPNQAIELSFAQIEQAKQAGQEYRLSIMPGHDPESKESHEAHSKALQDYQMSLMTLDCGKHQTRRHQMRRMTQEEMFHTYGHFGNEVSDPVPSRTSALQDFDFDSFLHWDDTDQGFSFDFAEPPATTNTNGKVEQSDNSKVNDDSASPVQDLDYPDAQRQYHDEPRGPARWPSINRKSVSHDLDRASGGVKVKPANTSRRRQSPSGSDATEQNPRADTPASNMDFSYAVPSQDILHDFDFDSFLHHQDSTSAQTLDFDQIKFGVGELKANEKVNGNEDLPAGKADTTGDDMTGVLGEQSSTVLAMRGGPPSRAGRGGRVGRGAFCGDSCGRTAEQVFGDGKENDVIFKDSATSTEQGSTGGYGPIWFSPKTAAPHEFEHDELPLFINPKQFHRILKRRMARQELQDLEHKRKTQRCHSTTEESSDDLDAMEISRDGNAKEELFAQSSTKVSSLGTDLNTDDVQVELTWTYPALSTTQTSKLWWQAYISLMPYGSNIHESPTFTTIKNGLESELGILPSRHVPDDIICRQIGDNVRRLGTASHQDKQGLVDVLVIWSSILKILATIDEQLGLEIATLAWSCVSALLSYYEKIITTSPPSEINTTFLQTSVTHLQDIVAIIARYAVMENLYQQSGNALSLKPEYRSALLSLCGTVLEYFAAAFKYARAQTNLNSDEDAKMEATLETRLPQISEGLRRCSFLVELIKQKDLTCQGFRVVVDTQEENSDDSENESARLEEESDEDWERIESEDVDSAAGL